jgi:hypothetical protein
MTSMPVVWGHQSLQKRLLKKIRLGWPWFGGMSRSQHEEGATSVITLISSLHTQCASQEAQQQPYSPRAGQVISHTWWPLTLGCLRPSSGQTELLERKLSRSHLLQMASTETLPVLKVSCKRQSWLWGEACYKDGCLSQRSHTSSSLGWISCNLITCQWIWSTACCNWAKKDIIMVSQGIKNIITLYTGQQ